MLCVHSLRNLYWSTFSIHFRWPYHAQTDQIFYNSSSTVVSRVWRRRLNCSWIPSQFEIIVWKRILEKENTFRKMISSYIFFPTFIKINNSTYVKGVKVNKENQSRWKLRSFCLSRISLFLHFRSKQSLSETINWRNTSIMNLRNYNKN